MRTRLRTMLPGDVPVVLERLREQNERDGTSYSMPLVFDRNGIRMPNIPLALVAVDIESGDVVQGHVYESTVEQMTFGICAEATVCSMREQEAVFFLLRERGFRDLHVLVPQKRAADMAHGLDTLLGLIDTGETLRHFYRMLDPAENLELRQWYEERGKKQ